MKLTSITILASICITCATSLSSSMPADSGTSWEYSYDYYNGIGWIGYEYFDGVRRITIHDDSTFGVIDSGIGDIIENEFVDTNIDVQEAYMINRISDVTDSIVLNPEIKGYVDSLSYYDNYIFDGAEFNAFQGLLTKSQNDLPKYVLEIDGVERTFWVDDNEYVYQRDYLFTSVWEDGVGLVHHEGGNGFTSSSGDGLINKQQLTRFNEQEYDHTHVVSALDSLLRTPMGSLQMPYELETHWEYTFLDEVSDKSGTQRTTGHRSIRLRDSAYQVFDTLKEVGFQSSDTALSTVSFTFPCMKKPGDSSDVKEAVSNQMYVTTNSTSVPVLFQYPIKHDSITIFDPEVGKTSKFYIADYIPTNGEGRVTGIWERGVGLIHLKQVCDENCNHSPYTKQHQEWKLTSYNSESYDVEGILDSIGKEYDYPVSKVETAVTKSFRVYQTDRTINLQNLTSNNVKIELFSLNGRRLFSQKVSVINGNANMTFPVHLSGVFITKISSDQIVTSKLLLR